MTRTVIVGPYPPTADPRGDVVLALVRMLRAGGSTVEVVSTDPSAAPHHGDPTTRAGAIRVAQVLRGADRALWFADAGRRAAPAARRALARVPVVEVQVSVGWPRGATSPHLERWRAGAPTLARSLAARVRVAKPGGL